MTISVCMATYNGAAYLEEQLKSILFQTVPPDEVVLCDDGSTDSTVAIIRKFIEEHRLQGRWRLYVNTSNKGYIDNFYLAMSLCTQDIVFLADQDDIWHEEKLAHMRKIFEGQPQVKAACCKFGLIDAQGKSIRTLMAPTHSRESGTIRQVCIEEVFYKCEWPGMVMAYRNQWYLDKKQKSHCIPQDLLIAACAAEEQGFVQLDVTLAYHRRHESNAGGEEHRIKRLLNKRRKLKEISDYLAILKAFEEERILQTGAGNKAWADKYAAMQGRYEALAAGKITGIIRNVQKSRGQVRLATVLCDLVIAHQR